jgi:hypothetical protein
MKKQPEYRKREGSNLLRWKDIGDGTNRMRYEKASPWHLPQPDSDAFRKGYEQIRWDDSD